MKQAGAGDWVGGVGEKYKEIASPECLPGPGSSTLQSMQELRLGPGLLQTKELTHQDSVGQAMTPTIRRGAPMAFGTGKQPFFLSHIDFKHVRISSLRDQNLWVCCLASAHMLCD